MYLLSTNLQRDVVQITVCRIPVRRAEGRVCNRHYGLTPKALNIWAALSFTLEMWLWLQAKKEKKIMNNNKHEGKKSGIKLCTYNTLIMLRSLLALGLVLGSSSQPDKRVSMGVLQEVLLAATIPNID